MVFTGEGGGAGVGGQVGGWITMTTEPWVLEMVSSDRGYPGYRVTEIKGRVLEEKLL